MLVSITDAQYDQDELIIFSTSSTPNIKDYFGASLLLINDPTKLQDDQNWLFIGAPKANDKNLSKTRPGTVWRCQLHEGQPHLCTTVEQTGTFCTQRRGPGKGQTPNCKDANIGLIMASGQHHVYICAPTQTIAVRNTNTNGAAESFYTTGGCYGMPVSSATNKGEKEATCYMAETPKENLNSKCSIMTIETFNEKQSSTRLNGFAATYSVTSFAGFSINVPKTNATALIMGAPFWYDGTGGAIAYSSLKAPQHTELMSFGQRSNLTAEQGSTKTELLGFAITSGSYFPSKPSPSNPLHIAITSTSNNRKSRSFPDLKDDSAGGVGAVYIVTLEDFDKTDNWIKSSRYKRMLQETVYAEYGSYFGYALESVDVNGDNQEELLVGAPYLRGKNGGYDYDVGQVTVFSFTSTNTIAAQLYPDSEAISKNQDIRFGMAIAKIGDINQDGFQDVAIGAPFENSIGAVYLFCGSTSGLTACGKLIPRAKPEVASPHWGFGYHIYGGVDIDNSSTPDVGVGWIGGDAIGIYRTRPNLNVSTSFITNPPTLKEDAERFNIIITAKVGLVQAYARPPVPLKTELDLHITVRVFPKSDFYIPVVNGSVTENKYEHTFIVKTAKSQAVLNHVILRNTSHDQSKDIEAPTAVIHYRISYPGVPTKCDSVFNITDSGVKIPVRRTNCDQKLQDGTPNPTYDFCPNCPYPLLGNEVKGDVQYCPVCLEGTASLPQNCNNTSEQLKACKPTIITSLKPRGNFSVTNQTILDRKKSLEFIFEVQNTGDKVRTAKLIFSMQTSDPKIRPTVVVEAEYRPILTFQSGNNFTFSYKNLTGADFLGKNTEKIGFVLGMESIKAYSKDIINVQFFASVSTNNAENEILWTESLTYSLVPDGSVGLTGNPEIRHLAAIKSWPTEVTHLRFTGKLTGASLAEANFKFLIPLCPSERGREISDGLTSTLIGEPRVGGQLQNCTRASSEMADEILYNNLLKSNATKHYSLCNRKKFVHFQCNIQDYSKFSDSFEVVFRVNLASPDAVNIINEEADKETKIHAIGWFSILGNNGVNDDGANHSAIALTHVTFKVQPNDLPFWVIIVAIAVGFLCLSCLTLGLYKCGFFRRKTKEELEELKAEMEDQQVQSTFPAAGADRYDDASVYCHDADADCQ